METTRFTIRIGDLLDYVDPLTDPVITIAYTPAGAEGYLPAMLTFSDASVSNAIIFAAGGDQGWSIRLPKAAIMPLAQLGLTAQLRLTYDPDLPAPYAIQLF